MGRTNRRLVLKTRVRKPGKIFGTKFSFSRNGSRKLRGRILSVEKVGFDELWRVGEYLPFNPDALLREFRETEKEKGGILK